MGSNSKNFPEVRYFSALLKAGAEGPLESSPIHWLDIIANEPKAGIVIAIYPPMETNSIGMELFSFRITTNDHHDRTQVGMYYVGPASTIIMLYYIYSV